MAKILDGPKEEDLNRNLLPSAQISFLVPELASSVKLDQNGWVPMHVFRSQWHACDPSCRKKKNHNLLHHVDFVGYVTQADGRKVPTLVKNFDIETTQTTRGDMRLGPKARIRYQ